jgi:WXG100 family type VII secretion target
MNRATTTIGSIMSSEIKVNQAGMSTLIDRLRESIQAIEGILRGLDEDVAKLRGAWGGEASDAYDRAQQRWTAELGQMNELLAHHRRSAIASAELFEDAVQKNKQIWS